MSTLLLWRLSVSEAPNDPADHVITADHVMTADRRVFRQVR